MSHTPGPWILARNAFNTKLSEKDREGSIGSIWAKEAELYICALDDLAEDDGTAQQEANARLIAAATELLAACQAIASCAGEGSLSFEYARKMARAAVKKAVKS